MTVTTITPGAQRAYLLDTHALLWWLTDDPALSSAARAAIAEPSHLVLVSAASAWEAGIKYQLGKLPEAADIVEHFEAYVRGERFLALDIRCDHALRAAALPALHRDPFDRMLIAQALIEDLVLISNETLFAAYSVKLLW